VSPAFLLAFFGIFVTNAKGARGEKTRVRSRTRGFSPAVYFSSQAQCSKRPTSASREFCGAPSHISERLPRFPPLLVATEGRVRHTDMCLARRMAGERSGSRPLLDGVCGENGVTHVMHHLLTDFYEKYFLTSRKNGKMYS